MRPAVVFAFLLLMSTAACAPAAEPQSPRAAASVTPRAPASAAPSLPSNPSPGSESTNPAGPLVRQARERPTSLEVPGFDDATLSFPKGSSTELVVIAAHGAGDTPEDQCHEWREILGDRGVVLCPAGPRIAVHSDGRYFPDHFALEKIVLATFDAFRKGFPEYARAMIVYAGYSQGATMGALMIVAHGDAFPRLALVEGGFDGWTLGRAEKFKSTGGRRVLFVCGTKHCRSKAEHSAETLRRAGVEVRLVSDLSAGHNYGGAAARAVENSLGWLLTEP